MHKKVTIIGTTTWGMTLGTVMARKDGMHVCVWARTEREAVEMSSNGAGPSAPGQEKIALPPLLSVTSSISEAMEDSKAVIMAVPSQAMRHNMKLVAEHIKDSMLVISAAKGLEIETGKRMSQVIAEEIAPELHPNICVLSGPNLSREIMINLPAAVVLAAGGEEIARKAQKLLSAPNLCVYTNTDIIGVELGGALKNIIALGAGIADGMGWGDNAKAAFMTRGLTEITALGVALGANPLTLSGLAGLGDLIATCASPLSRNHHVGAELAKGRPLQEITASMNGVAEGVATTLAVWKLAKELGIEMPITNRIYQVLYDGVDTRQAAVGLMAEETGHELVGRKWKLFSLFRRRKKSPVTDA